MAHANRGTATPDRRRPQRRSPRREARQRTRARRAVRHQPVQPAPGPGGAGGGRSGRQGDRPRRWHLHQPRAGAAQPVRRRRRPGVPRQPGLRRGNPRAVHEDHRPGSDHAAGAAHRRRRLRHRDPARAARRRLAHLVGVGAVSRRRVSWAARAANSVARSTKSWRTHYGLVTSRADERIEAVSATPEEANLLGDQAAVGPAAHHADHLRPARRSVRVLPRPVPRRPHPTRRHGERARDRRPAVGGHGVGGPAESGSRHQGQLTRFGVDLNFG